VLGFIEKLLVQSVPFIDGLLEEAETKLTLSEGSSSGTIPASSWPIYLSTGAP
jgi:hypothetical protein